MFKTLPYIVFFLLVGAIGIQGAQSKESDSMPRQAADEKIQSEIFQQADEVFGEVSRLRGLSIKSPVKKKMADRFFFREYYSRLLREQYPPEKKRATEKAYILLGFLPEKSDLIETYLDSFLKVVQGLYDPSSKTLYIADWIDPKKSEEVLSHELDHALQDQYFDLQAFLDKGKNASMDAQFARSSLMEGEANAIALNYSLQEKGSDFTKLVNIADWTRLNNLFEESGQKAFGRKAVLNDVINFPYVYGAAFLQKYIKAYGWPGMKSLFEHPPSSTHQIMHPDAFFPHRQNPIRVRVEDLSASALNKYKLIWENTFGEYGLTLLLRQYVPEKEAEKSVLGWRGDRIQIYESGDRRQSVLTGYIIFNKEGQAEDFFKCYRELLGKKYDLDIFRRSDDTIHWATIKGSDLEVYAERFGRRVVFIEGTEGKNTSRVRAVLWKVVQPSKSGGKGRGARDD